MHILKMICLFVQIFFLLVFSLNGQDIFNTARTGDLDQIKKLVEENPDIVTSKNARNSTPLHFAADGGNVQIAEYLITKGADLHATDVDGDIPLHWATFRGNLEMSKLLVEKGSDINFKNNNNSTPIVYSLVRKHKEVVDYLLEKNAVVETTGEEGKRFLHNAAIMGHEKLVNLLIKKGADINSINNFGGTLLHSAASGGLNKIVELMVSKGKNVNDRNRYGMTPLHLAATAGQKNTLELLINLGAIVSQKTNDGKNALNLAQQNKHSDITDLLMEIGMDNNPGEFPKISGEYLNLSKPGLIPEIFAPGIISTAISNERDITFSPDKNEFYFTRDAKIHYSKIENGNWTAPKPASFSDEYLAFEARFSPDGQNIYYISRRPKSGSGDPAPWEIWYVSREGLDWSMPNLLGSPFEGGYHPAFTKDRTLYFTSRDRDLFRSKLINGKYGTPEKLDSNVNTSQDEYNSFIDLDETYMIFTTKGHGEGFGADDLYISFRKSDGSWTKAKNMGPSINSPENDYCPSVTRDGKYFFFASRRYGNEDIFWVDATIINSLRE